MEIGTAKAYFASCLRSEDELHNCILSNWVMLYVIHSPIHSYLIRLAAKPIPITRFSSLTYLLDQICNICIPWYFPQHDIARTFLWFIVVMTVIVQCNLHPSYSMGIHRRGTSRTTPLTAKAGIGWAFHSVHHSGGRWGTCWRLPY